MTSKHNSLGKVENTPFGWSTAIYNKKTNTLTFEVNKDQVNPRFLKYLMQANNIPESVNVIYKDSTMSAPEPDPMLPEKCKTCEKKANCEYLKEALKETPKEAATDLPVPFNRALQAAKAGYIIKCSTELFGETYYKGYKSPTIGTYLQITGRISLKDGPSIEEMLVGKWYITDKKWK